MIEVIASLYDSVTNRRISAKKIRFEENDISRLSLTWAVQDKKGLSYSETVCSDLPAVGKKQGPTEGVKTSVAIDWVP